MLSFEYKKYPIYEINIRKKIIIILSIVISLTLIAVIGIFVSPIGKMILNSGDNGGYLVENLPSIIFDDEPFENYFNENQYNQDIQMYDIKLELDITNKIIYGDVTIFGHFIDSVSNKIILNFYDNLSITNITVNGNIVEYTHDNTDLILSNVDLSKSFEINILYNGTPKKLGFGSFIFGEYKGSPVVYSLNEPVFASTWFPCNDIPSDKALSKLSVTADSNLVTVSNGILVDKILTGDKATYFWETEYQTSTYLIAFCTADYVQFDQEFISAENDTIPLNYYVFQGKAMKAAIDFSIHPEAMKIFVETFGEYPFKNEKYGVAEFLWEYGAMESQTITGISTNMISGRKFYTDILVHELAHQWWGNAVGPKNWKEIWLNEGFASYSEALYWEYKSGEDALISTMQSKYSFFENTRLYNPKFNLFSKTIYDKGAWVLHMLRKEIGDDNFFSLLRNYYQKFKYKNASTNDLKLLAEEISGKGLDHFFNQWIFEGTGIIEIEYNWESEEDGSVINTLLQIEQIQNAVEVYKFPLDVLLFENEQVILDTTIFVNQRESKFDFTTNKSVSKIKLDTKSWLLAQISEAYN